MNRLSMKLCKKLFLGLSSFGFAAILLLFLLLLTWLGTLEQIEHGLLETQKKYFESKVLWHDVGPFVLRWPWADAGADPLATIGTIPIPLPGVYLLLGLLLMNLVLGGIVRLRKDMRRVGILIAHLGMVMMLVAGFVYFRWSIDGGMQVYPNEIGKEFYSYHDWDLTIRDGGLEGNVREQMIEDSDWRDLPAGATRRFTSEELPFDVLITRTFNNCRVVPKGPMFAGDGPVIDGYVVLAEPLSSENEGEPPNSLGLYATFIERATGKQTDAILWARQRFAFTLDAGGKRWLIDLDRRRFRLPFGVRLEKFNVEFHPNTTTARVFSSNVTKIEGGREQRSLISMNEPLRHEGYTLYQSDWGPKPRPGHPLGTDLYSVFTVVQNPSDQWPKWSCAVIAVGLGIHFLMRLTRYVKSTRSSS